MIEGFVRQIQEQPYYQVQGSASQPIIVFDDHRFVIPVLWLAHQFRIIDKCINMVRFDGHLDILDFNPAIVKEFRAAQDFSQVFDLCMYKLGSMDDDWQSLALHENLIQQVLVFSERSDDLNRKDTKRLCSLKRFNGILGYEGELSETKASPQAQMVRDILGWRWPGGLDQTPVLLDIDCDYFTFQWRKKIFPWLSDFYRHEFSSDIISSDVASGWSHDELFQKLVKKAPFITICREPDFCGGTQNTQNILGHLNKLLIAE